MTEGGDESGRARWWRWITVWTLLGLIVRIGTVIGRPHRVAGGDAYFYHNSANLLVAGKGFINPLLYYGEPHRVVQSASFPPGFVFVLAAASLVGFKSFFAQRIWCCLIGAAAIPICGLAGREIAGRRVGLMAACLVAIYPNIWMSDELAMSETLSPLLVAVVLLTAYRFWKKPGWRTMAWFGASIGIAALARDELALLGPFALVPMVLWTKAAWRRRAGYLAVGTLSALVVVAPWVGYNMSRFQKPVFISTGLGVTLASANCPDTYHGAFEGYWSWACALRAPSNPNADESVQGSEAQHYAIQIIRANSSRIIPVELARLGRAFGFFHPLQQIRLDSSVETRPHHWALVGLAMYYALVALSVPGVVLLRRRKVPIAPLVAVGLTVVVSVTLAFGTTRYRSPFEISLVVLSSVTLGYLWDRSGRGDREDRTSVLLTTSVASSPTGSDRNDRDGHEPAPMRLPAPRG
jgi:Dolichyl-phosphate-mannose-protein mannosyltransferase